jgi:hypothetical protein
MNLVKRIASRVRATADAGMTTAEYAVGTVAAVSLATVLYKVDQSSTAGTAVVGEP